MRTILTLAGLLAITPAIAVAQSAPSCDRQGATVCGPAKAAWLDKSVGDVVILSKAAVAMPVDGAALGTGLVENDRVLARKGSAVIDLGPGCQVSVPSNFSALVYRVDAARICVSVSSMSPMSTQGFEQFQAQAQGEPVVVGSVAAPAPVVAPVAAGLSPLVYGAGALAVAGGVAAIALGASKSSSPVSSQ